jgi:sRNA-binding protein
MASQYRIERDRGTQESRQQFAVLREKWPLAFPVKDQDVRPLAIGATGEIAAAMGWSLPYTLGVLGRWKMAPVYCQAVLCHDQRVALDGSPAETVDAEAKDLAAKQLLARLAARQVAKNTANAAVTQKPASAPPPAPPPETPKQLRGLVRASLLRQRVVRGKQMTSEGCGDNQKGERHHWRSGRTKRPRIATRYTSRTSSSNTATTPLQETPQPPSFILRADISRARAGMRLNW